MNERQKRFCDEYLIDCNATQAAIRAGYSEKTAYSQGQRMLKNIEVKTYIDEQLEQLHNEKIADAQEVLETLTRILRRQEKETVVVPCKRKRSYFDSASKKIVEENEEPMQVEIPTAVRDVNKAAEMLAKRYGLLVDKVSVQDDSEILVKIEYEDNTTVE